MIIAHIFWPVFLCLISFFMGVVFVLGGEYKQLSSGQDINDLTEGMYFSFSTAVIQSLLHGPGTTDQEIVIESHPRIKNNSYGYQLYYWIHEGRIWIRHYHNLQGWSSWVEIATGLPYFYKNYADLAALANGLGVAPLFSGAIGGNGTITVSVGYRVFSIIDNTGGNVSLFVNDSDDGLVQIVFTTKMSNKYGITQVTGAPSNVSIYNKTSQSRNITIFAL